MGAKLATTIVGLAMIAFIIGVTAVAGGFKQKGPKLDFAGLTYPRVSTHGQPICNENADNHKTFRFRLSGFTPNGSAMIIVRYPSGQFYWFHNSYGVVRVDGGGTYVSSPWMCWKGPNGSMDPAGKYSVTAIDFTSNKTAAKRSFMVVNP